MALITQDQFFEIWFPGSYWDQANKALGGHDTAGARRNARESENGRRQFNEAWNSFNRRQILLGSSSSVEEPFYGYKAPPIQQTPTPPPGVNFRDWINQFDAQYQAQVEYERVSNEALQAITEQKYALAEQAKQEEAVKAQYETLAAETQKQLGIAKKESSAAIGKQRAQSRIAQTQAQQELQRMAPRQEQTRQAGASVGQPGISKTKVGTRLALGGYGGTAAGKINPTGLNI